RLSGARRSAGDRRDAVVGEAVAVVVAAVADLGARRAAAAYAAIVDDAVAVVILAVAGLGLRAVRGRAAFRDVLAGRAVAVVVDGVGRLLGIVAKPIERIGLLRDGGTRELREVAGRVRCRDRPLIRGQTRRALRRSGPRAARLTDVAIMRVSLVSAAV